MFDTAGSVCPPEVDGPDFDPGPGPQWSTYLPDGLLADTLEHQSGQGSQWERLERIGAWERVVAWAQANQLREMATFARGGEQDSARQAAERAAARASGESVAPEVARIDGLESAAAEISLMLRIAPVTATSRLDDALTLTGRFPAAMAALAAGRITLPKARIIAEQTENRSGRGAPAPRSRQTRPGSVLLGTARRHGDGLGVSARGGGRRGIWGARRVRQNHRQPW